MAHPNGVRDAYTARASEYTELLGSIDLMAPKDRETIANWAKTIDGPIVDAGCGPGHWTKYLHDLGADVEGLDMVPEFVEAASERFPGVPFRVGTIDELQTEANSLSGLLSWYSLIHTSPEGVSAILDEFARCLEPDGSLLIGFFAGDRVEPFEHAIVTAYYWPVSAMRSALETAGFVISRMQTRTDPGSRPHAAVVAELRTAG